jgi:hypothetical protein
MMIDSKYFGKKRLREEGLMSMSNAEIRDAAREVMQVKDAFARNLVLRAIAFALGTERDDPWNVNDTGFIVSFVQWAIRRRIIERSFLMEEDPEWKLKFQEYDCLVLEAHCKLIDSLQASNADESDKSTRYMIAMLRMEERGYFKMVGVSVDEEDED